MGATSKGSNTNTKSNTNKYYFEKPLKINDYENKNFSGNEVYVFKQEGGTYFSISVKSNKNIHYTIDYKSIDSNGKINSIVFNNSFKQKLIDLLNLFSGVEYQLYCFYESDKNSVTTYAIYINDNIIDMNDTISLLSMFDLEYPNILYNGVFNKNKIEQLHRENGNLFIRSDYDDIEPNFNLSLYTQTKKKLPEKTKTQAIKEIDSFIFSNEKEIEEDVLSEFLNCNIDNIYAFISYYMKNRYVYYENTFYNNSSFNEKEFENQIKSIFKKKFSFKVKLITEA